MSSKPVPDRRAWSLAARLTLWYAGTAFVLVACVTAFMYRALVRSLDREDDQALADKVRIVLTLGDAPLRLRREVDESRQTFQHSPVFVRVVGPGGGAEAETPGMAEVLPAAAFPPATDRIDAGTEVWTAGGRFRVLAVTDPRTGRVVQAGIDRTQDGELLAAYRRYVAFALAAALAASAVVSHRIARRGLRPVRLVAATARRIEPTNLGERIAADGLPAELLALADTFNLMFDRLEASFARLARFSADIAHELRTPVNNLRGEVEVALGQPRTPDQYREFLASNLEVCGRLGRLIDSLLFLARAENTRTPAGTERLEVGGELRTVYDYYETVAVEKGVTPAVAVAGAVHHVPDRTLFQRAVGNVVENAIRHTPPGGTVTLVSGATGTAAAVEVIDTGGGIPAAHLSHVFDRFYRVDPARSSDGRHVGLGLSIVKSVVELHGGGVEIASGGGGSRVVMTFPSGGVRAAWRMCGCGRRSSRSRSRRRSWPGSRGSAAPSSSSRS